MTGNDKQIDVLIRRHAQSASRVMVAEHLDADEMSAFAEGQLPPAARAQYVSHLADCDQCRRTVSQLAISGGAIRAEPVVEKTDRSLWQTLAGLFAIPALRYTAFAAVVLIVGAVGYIALRSTSERPANLVARNEATEDQPASAVKPNQPAERGKLAEASKDVSDRQTDKSQPAAPEAKEAKRFDEAKPTDIATADAFKDTPATTVEMK
jgi:hypothetical protein